MLKIARVGTSELPRSGKSGSIFIARRCWASIHSGWYGAAELPSGSELEQAAMEKLRTWASFLDPDVTIPRM